MGKWDNEWCKENVLCHESPQNPRCLPMTEPPSCELDNIQCVKSLFCSQNPRYCPFVDPLPLELPEPDPCLDDGCPFPWPHIYYGQLIQQAQIGVLDDKITVMQKNVDSLKIDSVPLPEDKLNVALALAGIAAAGSIGAVITSFRRKL